MTICSNLLSAPSIPDRPVSVWRPSPGAASAELYLLRANCKSELVKAVLAASSKLSWLRTA
uniref:Uncharacterized protein n=1 Tax=Arundo donax TaxID=35708 RepID=A0A0A9F953_ARUDO